MEKNNRRSFIKKSSLLLTPFLIPMAGFSMLTDTMAIKNKSKETKNKTLINFIFDGLFFSPKEYIQKLQEIDTEKSIEMDMYGHGGATKLLEESFAKLTGKEKAIYLPSGTMANQIAIKLLSGDNTKIIVPENSHIYRDEADAAQSVHHKRLIPIGKDKPFFTREDLKRELAYLDNEEVFKSGLNTITIENPIRRTNGTYVPIETIQEISKYCREKGLKMHLDGARIHIAAAFSNSTIADYSSNFDTVYISLYKYLNATGGAILCGDANIIDKVEHQIKILGGNQFQSWNNTAMALHYLTDVEIRWKEIARLSSLFVTELNKIEGVQVSQIKNGTNVLELKLDNTINPYKLGEFLYNDHTIWIGGVDEKGILNLTLNESLTHRTLDDIILGWKDSIAKTKKATLN
ncbi:MAG: aminotransferase class I/II-fold pyridoxal phosphate-dependent enzyme [Flavobacteriia bacterium]|nr:aminotransferase class I/II-fold pyridoxal phosphate-dependent enzyme [Flavobacteriia bacterium]